jgi:glycolate oxidase FAD binding subunit
VSPPSRKGGAPGAAPAARGTGARGASPEERCFFGPEVEVLSPDAQDALAAAVAEASREGRPLLPAGAGRHAYLGNLPPDGARLVSLEKFRRIVRYEPADFTVGVQSGMPIRALQDELAANGQEIGVDLPASPPGTIGGAVAADRSGPRRARHGGFRQRIIGIAGLRGAGTVYRAGGMVVKNVAGYDIGKMLAGSLGTLGPILELNFKLLPLPAARAGGVFSFAGAEAAWSVAAKILEGRLQPAALCAVAPAGKLRLPGLDGTPPSSWRLVWVFEGNRGTVAELASRVERLPLEVDAAPDARRLDDAALPAFLEAAAAVQAPDDASRTDLAIVRLAVAPRQSLELRGAIEPLLEEHGVVDEGCLVEIESGIATLRLGGRTEALAALLRGLEAVLRRCRARGRLLFASPALRQQRDFLLLPDPLHDLCRRLQRVFDPAGIFHPARVSRAKPEVEDQEVSTRAAGSGPRPFGP